MTATKKHKFSRSSLLCLLCLFVAHTVLGNDGSTKPTTPKPAAQETSVIIVNERDTRWTKQRGAIAWRTTVSPRRNHCPGARRHVQLRFDVARRDDSSSNGITAIFNAPLNEVRENGAVVLTVSGTADLVFPPTPNELMLPAEIVAALLMLSFVATKAAPSLSVARAFKLKRFARGGKHAPWQIFQLEYDYNFSRYTASGRSQPRAARHWSRRRRTTEFHHQLIHWRDAQFVTSCSGWNCQARPSQWSELCWR